MRKRDRENLCEICGHYHECDEGEICGVCGHKPGVAEAVPLHGLYSAPPTEILKEFLFLGSYDNASRSEALKTLNITHILNTLPRCRNFDRKSFTYHQLQDDKTLDFYGAGQFLEKCEREKSRVLVHCISGKNRSAAVVTAFLMKSRGWRLVQCFQWVKNRRPQVQLTDAFEHQLVEYEQKLFGPTADTTALTESFHSLGFGFPTPPTAIQAPAFGQGPGPSIFERARPIATSVPSNFTFGAEGTIAANPPPGQSSSDIEMDSS